MSPGLLLIAPPWASLGHSAVKATAASRTGTSTTLTPKTASPAGVLRDVMSANRHSFGELHAGSMEGIATNILTDRLRKLVDAGLLTREPVAGHKQRIRYELTESALDLFPVQLAMATFSIRHLDPDADLASWVRDVHAGGSERQAEVLEEIRRRNGLADVRSANPVVS